MQWWHLWRCYTHYPAFLLNQYGKSLKGLSVVFSVAGQNGRLALVKQVPETFLPVDAFNRGPILSLINKPAQSLCTVLHYGEIPHLTY